MPEICTSDQLFKISLLCIDQKNIIRPSGLFLQPVKQGKQLLVRFVYRYDHIYLHVSKSPHSGSFSLPVSCLSIQKKDHAEWSFFFLIIFITGYCFNERIRLYLIRSYHCTAGQQMMVYKMYH